MTRRNPGGPPPELIAKAIQHFREQDEKRRLFRERWGYARLPVSARMGDKRMMAIGGGIYMQTREGGYNLADMLHDNALNFFGAPFLEAEEAKPFAARHPALQWMYTFVAHEQRGSARDNSDPRARQIGAGAAWLRLGYDLFTIGDNAKLEARLKARLMDPTAFQAARHELKVAALCLVAGFEIDFEDEGDVSSKHPEFIARDRLSPAVIAVEAKSRHRRGVQGYEGGRDIQPGESVDVRQPILDAYTKASSLPLYVFVDPNLPPVAHDSVWIRWMGEINTTMADLTAEGYASPSPANMVIFTNDCSHYLGDQQIGNDADRLWIKYYTATSPRVPHPDTDMAARLVKAHDQRLSPPAEFPDFQ
jgi:hypothetical protein